MWKVEVSIKLEVSWQTRSWKEVFTINIPYFVLKVAIFSDMGVAALLVLYVFHLTIHE